MSASAITKLKISAYQYAEWTLTSDIPREDPWTQITVTAVMRSDDGRVLRVPAFWDGGGIWRFRLTADAPGRWTVRSECSDTSDARLHGQEAELEVAPPDASAASRFYRHGPVRIARGGRHFEHADGTVFHWLGDTWWMLMSERVSWPEGFSRLTARRVQQGFTVVQTVVGFQPDTRPFDGRDANAGGSPWEVDYKRINPGFFQACDRRLRHLVEQGIAPCILGGWGYHMSFMGVERMIQHWRYLVARYAAWPVIWCLAGEGAMPYYLAEDREAQIASQKRGWPKVARVVRDTDPWRRPLTLHPRQTSWDDTAEPDTLDFHMLQAGHLPNAPLAAQNNLAIGRARYPGMPIVNGEPPYEGHAGTNLADVQRYSFWTSMLCGASGYTYGAAGIFQANDRERPTGDRPDGGAFDAVTWDEAMMFRGAEQVARGHALLTELGVHRFEPHPEWVKASLRWGHEAYPIPWRAFAAGIPGECRVIYLPVRWYHWEGPLVRFLEPGIKYKAAYIEPNTFKSHELGVICGDAEGQWQAPTLPHMYDWLLVLRKQS